MTRAQKVRFTGIAARMNRRLFELMGLELDVGIFTPGNISSRYLTVPLGIDIHIDPDVIRNVQREFEAEIVEVQALVDPAEKAMADLTSIAIWETKGAFLVRHKPPYFRLSNGSLSPVYIDIRRLWTEPNFMDLITSLIRLKLEPFGELDGIAGGAVAGVPFASYLAKSLGTKLIVVRKEAKDHGMGNAVEGMEQGDIVILVEDIITDGGSKTNFIKHLQKCGKVEAVVVVFDREQGGKELLLKEFGIPLISLVEMKEHLKIGLENDFISQKTYHMLIEYSADPKGWNDKQDS